jgi:hypothetical protein
MKKSSFIVGQRTEPGGFDLFRLSKSKDVVDVCANTLREYHRKGLPFYRNGRAVFVSKAELEQFLRANAKAPAFSTEAGK